MTLDPGALRSGLAPVFDPRTMPADVPTAVRTWSQAYASYAQQALAGGCLLTAPLSVSPVPADFLDALDSTLRLMWMTAVWAGPGLVGVTLLVPPLQPLLLVPAPLLVTSADRDLALSSIVAVLHTYTMSITVTVTPVSGTPTVATLL